MLLHSEAFAKDYLNSTFLAVALIIGKTFLLIATKMMVITNEKSCYTIAPFKVVYHELACRKLGKFCGEIEENHLVHARLFEQLLLLRIAREELRDIVFV